MASAILSLATLVASGVGGKTYPLAAAMVIDGKVVVVDVPTRTAKPLSIGDLVPEEADLSPDKRRVVFNARPKAGEGPARLYFLDVVSARLEPVKTTIAGEHRFPRFADAGATVYFTATKTDAPGTPDNPGRIHRLKVSSRSVADVATPPGLCDFSPVGLLTGRVAYLSTSCFIGFELNITDTRKNKTKTFASVSSPQSELAASLDGKNVLYTTPTQQGLGFFLAEPDQEPRSLVTVVATEPRVQPRFVCPKDAVFLNAGKIWALDTADARLHELIDLGKPTAWSDQRPPTRVSPVPYQPDGGHSP